MKQLNLAILAIILLAVPAVFAQKAVKPKTSTEGLQTAKLVQSVEVYVKTIEDFVEKEGKPHLVIADVADYNEAEEAVWKKFASEAAFEKSRETEESYTIAYIWKKDGKPVQINFTYSSPSGDWAEYFFQTYREDGTLAKVNRELRTFLGDVIVNRIKLFDEKGKLLKETVTYRNLETGKPIKPTDNFMNVEAGQIYMKTSDLPFASILFSETEK